MKLTNKCKYYPLLREFLCCESSHKADCLFRKDKEKGTDCFYRAEGERKCLNLIACELEKNNFIHHLKKTISSCEVDFKRIY